LNQSSTHDNWEEWETSIHIQYPPKQFMANGHREVQERAASEAYSANLPTNLSMTTITCHGAVLVAMVTDGGIEGLQNPTARF